VLGIDAGRRVVWLRIKQPDTWEAVVADPLAELEERRARLFEQLAQVGDFRRGSISENYRRCGKPNCACARPDHPGHGPRFLWTRSVPGRGTRGRQLAAGEVEKVRPELAGYDGFARLSEQIVEVSETICESRPIASPVPADRAPDAGDEKGGSARRPRRRSPPK